MRHGKNIRDLTFQEKQDFINAVWKLKRNGKYNQYVKWHVDAMTRATPAPGESPNPQVRNAAHRGPAFLPWHREFLRRFEKDLRAEVPGVTIPYWDWTQDAELSDPKTAPIWNDDFMGGDGDPSDNNYVKTGPFKYDPSDSTTWRVANTDGVEINDGLRRELGVRSSSLPTADHVTTAQNTVPYDQANWNTVSSPSYRNIIEGWLAVDGQNAPNLHNRGHMFVGGSMMPMTSPNDPVFFLHHCFVDKLWADWQRQHLSESYVPTASHRDAPPGHRLNDAMYPWSTTPADVLADRPSLDVPRSVFFGRVAIGDIRTRVVPIKNDTGSDVTISGLELPPGWPFLSRLDGSHVIRQGEERRLTVEFLPSWDGEVTTTLTISATDSGSPHSITLQGIGDGTIDPL